MGRIRFSCATSPVAQRVPQLAPAQAGRGLCGVCRLRAKSGKLPGARRLARKQLPARNLMATAFELTGGRALADVAGPLRAMGSWLGSLGLDDPEEVVETFAVWLATTMPWFFPEDRALEMVGDFVGLEKQEEAMMALMEEQMKREKKLKAASLREGRREGRQEGRQEGLQEGWQKGRVDTQLAMLRRLATLKFDADTGSRLGALLDGVSDQAAFDELSAAIVNGTTPTGLLECAADAQRTETPGREDPTRLDGRRACRASPERRAFAMGSRHRTATDSPLLADTHQGLVAHRSPKPPPGDPGAMAVGTPTGRVASWPCAVRAST